VFSRIKRNQLACISSLSSYF